MSKSQYNPRVFRFNLYGKREDKYEFLNGNSLSLIAWNELDPLLIRAKMAQRPQRAHLGF